MAVVTAALGGGRGNRGGTACKQKEDNVYIPFCCKFLVTGLVLSFLVTGIAFLVISGDASKRCTETTKQEEARAAEEEADPKRYEVLLDGDECPLVGLERACDGVTDEWKRSDLLPPDVTLDPNADGTDSGRSRVIVKKLNRWGVVLGVRDTTEETVNTGRRRLQDALAHKGSGGKNYSPSGGGADGTDAIADPCASTQSYTTTGALMLSFGILGLVIAVAVLTDGCRCCWEGGLRMCVREEQTLPRRQSVRDIDPKLLPPDEIQMAAINDGVIELSERSSNV